MDKLSGRVLLKKGAEASLYIADWHEQKVLIKVRIPKKYRPKLLDERIRNYRTMHEPQLMHEAKAAGVPTPLIYLINISESLIVMEFIEGTQIKQLLNSASETERHKLCVDIGELIGKLHKHNLIHGDLTTSNMILNKSGKLFIVDFGLGEKNIEIEAKGVDLHLMKRTLQSTHYQFWEKCFNKILCGYSSVLGIDLAESILKKICEIEMRGRYVDKRKQ